MKIELNVERTRWLNEAFQAVKEREGAIRDQELLDLEEPDERLRWLVQAKSQLAQAQLCYWGLPTQAVIWAYQAIDNSIHAALLADDRTVSRNHQRKIEEFKAAFQECSEDDAVAKIAEACKLWNSVRYDRSAVSRETGQGLVNLAHDMFEMCCDLVGERIGTEVGDLDDRLVTIMDKVRLPELARSEPAMERIEMYSRSREYELESMGLSGIASQVASGARDIDVEIVADRAWARDLIENDPQIAEEIAAIHTSFHRIATVLFAKRVAEKFESDPEILDKPEEVISTDDFNVACLISYAGLTTMNTVERVIALSRQAN